jgi:glycosyltransferase involved in cell wall biosynthesis
MSFVEDLTRLAPVVLFLAAIPGQGGTDHINEQWQSDWATIFARYDFVSCDALRPLIWDNADIARWYRQKVRINWRTPADGILLSEKRDGPSSVTIRPQYYSSPVAGNRLFAPYFGHPEFYRTGLYNLVRGMRNRERNVRIFFAGTLSDAAYSEKFQFPILDRDQVLGHVMAKFEWAIKTEISENGSRPICIVSTGDLRDSVDKHKLPMRDYLDAMSRSDFFICPPGVRMPHSHNLIEAMSVGTIPITNYDSYMRPTLTPGDNCLAFSTVEELEIAINRALRMSAREIQRMRESVISYYEEHIEPASFGKKLMEQSASISELVVNDESGSICPAG